ncbi:MAG: STAS domain-containing protein [Phycisphaerales bacterium]|nr:MAG: STAS domain-containing protein [Phycisphaerales bacterium]
MGIQDWSENVISVDLRAEPETREQIDKVIHQVRDRGNCGVVMDFSNVTILTSTSLAALLRLRKLLGDCGQRLLLCSVSSATKGVISVTGLDGVFEIVDDRFDALAKVEAMPNSPVASAAKTL